MDYEPYFIRQRQAELQEQPTIYLYDVLPSPFRVQVLRILVDVIGKEEGIYRSGSVGPTNIWNFLWSRVAYHLGIDSSESQGHRRLHWLVTSDPARTSDEVLTAIEVAFRFIQNLPEDYSGQYGCYLTTVEGVGELNAQFQRHNLGYALEDGLIVRIDSQYLHTEAVHPSLQLLNNVGFANAQTEFLKAHQHFRHGDNEAAIVEALKAFESTMKYICAERSWIHSEGATAKELIRIVIDNGLFPKSMESFGNSFRTLLESGLPTVRNKNAAHGLGPAERRSLNTLTAFALHLAATNIVFLVECFSSTSEAD